MQAKLNPTPSDLLIYFHVQYLVLDEIASNLKADEPIQPPYMLSWSINLNDFMSY
jgi:hypothetical protein